jgi:ribosomal protein L37E
MVGGREIDRQREREHSKKLLLCGKCTRSAYHVLNYSCNGYPAPRVWKRHFFLTYKICVNIPSQLFTALVHVIEFASLDV